MKILIILLFLTCAATGGESDYFRRLAQEPLHLEENVRLLIEDTALRDHIESDRNETRTWIDIVIANDKRHEILPRNAAKLLEMPISPFFRNMLVAAVGRSLLLAGQAEQAEKWLALSSETNLDLSGDVEALWQQVTLDRAASSKAMGKNMEAQEMLAQVVRKGRFLASREVELRRNYQERWDLAFRDLITSSDVSREILLSIPVPDDQKTFGDWLTAVKAARALTPTPDSDQAVRMRLITAATNGHCFALAALGDLRRPGLVPLYRLLLSETNPTPRLAGVNRELWIALAKVNDASAWTVIDEELSSDPLRQQAAIETVAAIGGSRGIAVLVRLLPLDQPRETQVTIAIGDTRTTSPLVLPAPGEQALRALESLVAKPPIPPPATFTPQTIRAWQQWKTSQ